MDKYINIITLIVLIIQTVMLGTLTMIIMTIYKEDVLRFKETAEKVEEVREDLKVTSSELAQEKTLKTLEGKAVVVEE